MGPIGGAWWGGRGVLPTGDVNFILGKRTGVEDFRRNYLGDGWSGRCGVGDDGDGQEVSEVWKRK